MTRLRWTVVLLAVLSVAAETRESPSELGALLSRVGLHVREYYVRAQSLVCIEKVRVIPADRDGFARQLVYEQRIAWDAAEDGDGIPEANVVRQLRTINGRAPRKGEEPGCLDPKSASPEPLALFLPHHRDEYEFSRAGETDVDRRRVLMLDYKERPAGPPEITWKNDCISVSLPGRAKGRIWIDPANDEVMRLDEHLGVFEFRVPDKYHRSGPAWMRLERADTSIRYKRVAFREPDETLMLPSSIETVVMWGAGGSSYRIYQEFTEYKRFLTDAHIVQ
jgi:hypothetical protein